MPGLAVRHMAPARACPRDEWQEKMVTSSHIAPIRFRSRCRSVQALPPPPPPPPSSTWESIHKEPPAPRVHLTPPSSPHVMSCTHTFFGSVSSQQHPELTPWGSFWVLVCHNAATSSVCVSVSVGKFFIIFFWKVSGLPQLHESEMQ